VRHKSNFLLRKFDDSFIERIQNDPNFNYLSVAGGFVGAVFRLRMRRKQSLTENNNLIKQATPAS